MQSYRESHKRKGLDYHQTFVTERHRAMLWRLEQRILDQIFDRYLADRDIDYLDFACGTGRILGFLQSRVQSATGIDVSSSMLEVARAHVPGARALEGDITREPVLAGERFGLITAFRFFPNAEPELRADVLRALVRLLGPGGWLVFNNHVNSESLVHRIVRLLGRGGDSGMTDSEVRSMVEQAGLRVVEACPLGVLPITDRHMLRPEIVAETVERALAHFPGVTRLAQDVIYVCSKRG